MIKIFKISQLEIPSLPLIRLAAFCLNSFDMKMKYLFLWLFWRRRRREKHTHSLSLIPPSSSSLNTLSRLDCASARRAFIPRFSG
jgi:hypothetical protein